MLDISRDKQNELELEQDRSHTVRRDEKHFHVSGEGNRCFSGKGLEMRSPGAPVFRNDSLYRHFAAGFLIFYRGQLTDEKTIQ